MPESRQPSEADDLIARSKPTVRPTPPSDHRSLSRQQRQLADLRLNDHKLDTGLKNLIGRGATIAMFTQLILANGGFAAYIYWMQWVKSIQVPDAVMIGWLTATFVEVVGLVLVVAKYIFPSTGNNWNHERAD